MIIPEMPHKICYSLTEAEQHATYAREGCFDGETVRIVPNSDDTRFIVEILDCDMKRIMLF